MTALTIIRELKRDRSSALWINHDRRAAAFHRPSESACVPVAYSDAIIAKTDPALWRADECDGDIFAAI